MGSDGSGQLDELLGKSRPSASLDEQIALSSLEAALFDRPEKPLTLARYVLSERLGEGASGLVYRAYDPELDRRVAIKLLQAISDRDGAGADRLLSEAQALARLSHPNVVAVHDVGSYSELDLGDPGRLGRSTGQSVQEIPERGVFIVMEFVAGETLADWLGRNRARTHWRSLVDLLVAAGRGLSAAHEAGLIHRDFKPANVLVGDDGRPRVLDFGLALASGPGDHADSAPAENGAKTIAGTLAYMAPEQHRGEPADCRSDQYAYAVTIYYALVGRLPFTSGARALEAEKEKGPAQALDEPEARRLPRHLRVALQRALDPEPSRRFESMDSLLAALEHDPRRRRRRVIGAGLVTASLIAGAMLAPALRSGSEPCGDVTAPMDEVWNDEARAATRRAFSETGLPFAVAEWRRVGAALDDYAARWSSSRVDACEATLLRKEQSTELLDRRVACLDRTRRSFDGVVRQLAHVDADSVEQGAVLVASLPPIDGCDDIDALVRGIDPPPTDEARAQVDALYARLTAARGLFAAGNIAEAQAMASEVVERAAETRYDPLVADAELALARFQGDSGKLEAAEQHLRNAILAAERSRDDRTAAEGWIELVWLVGVEQSDTDAGESWVPFAEAAIARLGPDRRLEARLAHNLGGLRYAQHRHQEALSRYQVALDMQRELYGPDHPVVAQTLNHMGNVLIMLGEDDRAFELCGQAGMLRRRALGERHPLVAATLSNQAVIRKRQGRLREANTLIDEALTMVRGTDSTWELVAVSTKADLLYDAGKHEEARDAARRVAELGLAIHGADHWTYRNASDRVLELDAALADPDAEDSRR